MSSDRITINGVEILAHDLARELFQEHIVESDRFMFHAEFNHEQRLIIYYSIAVWRGGIGTTYPGMDIELDLNDPDMGKKLRANIEQNLPAASFYS